MLPVRILVEESDDRCDQRLQRRRDRLPILGP
jgi:hypothetical protein